MVGIVFKKHNYQPLAVYSHRESTTHVDNMRGETLAEETSINRDFVAKDWQ